MTPEEAHQKTLDKWRLIAEAAIVFSKEPDCGWCDWMEQEMLLCPGNCPCITVVQIEGGWQYTDIAHCCGSFVHFLYRKHALKLGSPIDVCQAYAKKVVRVLELRGPLFIAEAHRLEGENRSCVRE